MNFIKKIRAIIPVITVFSFLFAFDLAAMKKSKQKMSRKSNHEINREINTDASEELSQASFDANNTFKVGEIVIVERSGDKGFRYGQIVYIQKSGYNVLVKTPMSVKEGMPAKLIGKLPDGKDEKKEAKKTKTKKVLRSLNDFAKLCSKTPEYRVGIDLRSISKNDFHPAIISEKEIMSLVTEFVKRKQSTGFFDDEDWLATAPSADLFENFPQETPESHALPFVQKLDLDLKYQQEVYTIGDIHGSVHSLIRTLLQWKKAGIINDRLEIIKSGCTLVFTGDFVDRGRYGVEVFALLLVLKLAEGNWDHVHLLRGNHEDKNICTQYGFSHEIQFKYNSEELFNALCAVYELCPFALFVYSGKNKDGLRVYGQFCHGGLSPEHNLLPLLASETATCELLVTIDDKYTTDNNLFVKLGAQNIISANHMLESDPEANKHWFDGYTWTDFCQEHDNNAHAGTIIPNEKRGIGHKADVQATAAFLHAAQCEENNVCLGYFARGHQDQGACGKLFFNDNKEAAKLTEQQIIKHYPHGPYDWKNVVPKSKKPNDWISLCNGTHAPIITMSTATEGQSVPFEGFCVIQLSGEFEKAVFKIIEAEAPEIESKAPDKDKSPAQCSKKRKNPEDDEDYVEEPEEEEDCTRATKRRKIESKKDNEEDDEEEGDEEGAQDDGKACCVQ